MKLSAEGLMAKDRKILFESEYVSNIGLMDNFRV